MAFLDSRAVYTDPLLTNFSLGYADQNFIADQVMPLVPTALPSGRYRVFNRNNWGYWPSRREPGAIANEVRGYTWSEDTFATKQHSLQAAVDDEEVQNSVAAAANQQANLLAGLEPHSLAVQTITRSILIEYELAVANVITNSSNYTAGTTNTVALSGTARWDTTTSTPMTDIVNGMNAIFANIGEYPNLMVIPYQVWTTLGNNPSILTRFQYVSAQVDIVNAINVITGFNGTILIPQVIYNTADSVNSTASLSSNIWGKNVWMGKVDSTPSMNTQTFGKTFYQPVNGALRSVDRWREENRKSDLVRVTTAYDTKICSAAGAAGYLIRTVIS